MDDVIRKPRNNRHGDNHPNLGRKLPRRAMEAKHFRKKAEERRKINRAAKRKERSE